MNDIVLKVAGLRRFFAPRRRGGPRIRAVDTVDFDLRAGEILGILGESGSGKSTLAELVAGLRWPSEGRIEVMGTRLDPKLPRREWRALRRQVQIVFQNPFDAVNARLRIADIVAEPYVVDRHSPAEIHARIAWALTEVGLPATYEFLRGYPHELSGGQLQRVCIARALTVEPRILVADEPVSMLDLSVRAGVLRLLDRIRRERGMAILLISHDVSTLLAVSDRIGAMYRGEIVEMGRTADLLARPAHPYFRALLAAVPSLSDNASTQDATNVLLYGESHGAGCRLAGRCPVAVELCRTVPQELATVPDRTGHLVRCWRAAAGEI